MYDLVIKNGTIVTAEASYRADVAIEGERIAAIGRNLAAHKEIDATGKLVTPGAVDIHVHLQLPLPGVVSADTFFTGTRAAALGGTTTVVDFVHSGPQHATLLDALADRRAEADPQVVIDYALHMALGPADIAKLDQLPAVFSAGCRTFKLYMAYGFALNDSELLQTLTAIKGVGGLPVIHAENWPIITTLQQQYLAVGKTSPRNHPLTRPAIFEGEAVARAITIAEYVGSPLHIFHVSCHEAVAEIATARRRGLPVTGETCPQYLFLNDSAFEGERGALPICSPPIREQAQQDALWRAITAGDLQVIATDHCPFTIAEKQRDNFVQVPGGVPSIEMRFGAIYSNGVQGGMLTENQWVDLCCTTPARLTGLERKGQIAPDFDADIVIFDPLQRKLLSTDTLHESCDWTPYDGMEVTGWAQTVLSRGRVVVEDGVFVGGAGFGRFV